MDFNQQGFCVEISQATLDSPWRSHRARHPKMVGMTGFEPATLRTPCVCSTKLSYMPFLGIFRTAHQDHSLLHPG
jgi:hypothetical protein